MLLRLLTALLILSGCVGYEGAPEDLSFVAADGVHLAGTLVIPETETREFPAVVVLHGSEPATRSLGYRAIANIFLERGVAVLLYDKRGAGDSGGDHGARTFETLLRDAQAALAAVRAHPDVDPDAVGVVASSESGWFTPELAERDSNLAFVVNKSSPCESWRQTVAWELYHEALDAGADSASATDQVSIFEQIWAYRLTPNPSVKSDIESTLAEWADRPHSVLPETLNSVSESYVARVRYDPSEALARLATPTLYVYGETDVAVPSARCAAALEALSETGRPVTVRIVEGEGHELGGVGLTGYRLAPEFIKAAGDFAARHAR